jgi:hypothetical protein
VHAHLGAGLDELLDELQRRRLADVVGARLERQAPHGDAEVLEGADVARELLEEHGLLAGVDGLGRAHDGEVDVVALGEVQERRDVLGEAAPAVARAREEELRPDALVAADALAHGAHVGPDGLAQPARCRS